MDKIQCFICGSEANDFVFEKEGLRFYRCLQCDVVFIWPQKALEKLSDMYQEWGRDYYLDPKKIEYDYSSSFEYRLAQLEPYRKNNRLLDVGCSLGAFLSAARDKRWDCYGVELSAPSALYAKNEKKLNVFNGTLADARYPKDFFDVINIWAVLEHVPDPAGLLHEAQTLLRPGGLVVFCVPNYNNLPIKMLGKKYRYICEGHLFYFTRKTVAQIVQKAGLKPIKITSDYFSPFSFLEDMRGVKPDTMKTHEQEREKLTVVKENSAAKIILKPCWKAFLFFLQKSFLGENLVVFATK